MKQVLLLLMLAGVTHAFFTAETQCNATYGTSLCSSTLGGTVSIQVMTNASGYLLLCKKQLPSGYINVFTLKKGKVTIHGPFKNRTEFFINSGTLKITNVEKSDSGQYNIEVYDPNGAKLRSIEVELDINVNIWLIVISVCSAVAVLLIVVILCCACRRARRNKKKGKKDRVKQ
ncbi:uncharacterized protein LOC121516449 isoform X2 [Cheilinus undulatus]|uniref:uncharacterized protein LOC121516449 isoform X2 n=1 Tax=Cheilinus undulatus TaxID=241271 RepID=UPI001BD2CD49|nr:uncharacterized protein LOC121516449 isoform X2 [Cheilinus undulatus]